MFKKSTVIAALIYGIEGLTLQQQIELDSGSYESMDLVSHIAQDIELNESLERRRHHQVKSVQQAIQNEENAEEEANIAQQEFLQARSKKQQLKAKKNLKHVKHRLIEAEEQLNEVELQEHQFIAKPMPVPISSQPTDDKAAMKKYFMQSKVYQQFKEEQDSEMKEDEECQDSQEEFKDLKAKFIDLSEKYNDLQDQVHIQTLKTNQLVQKIKNPALSQATPDPTENKVSGVVPPPPDRQYDIPAQMRHPIAYENRKEKDDIMHYYNPNKQPTPQNYLNEQRQVYKQLANATSLDKTLQNVTTLAAINPANPTGLEPAPVDRYYDEAPQMRKPITEQNQSDKNDVRNVYNANKGPTPSNIYSQINPANPTGLEPPPVDRYYDEAPQMRKPINEQNQLDKNDVRNVYNSNKGTNPSNLYAQVTLQTEENGMAKSTRLDVVPGKQPSAQDSTKQAVKKANQEQQVKVNATANATATANTTETASPMTIQETTISSAKFANDVAASMEKHKTLEKIKQNERETAAAKAESAKSAEAEKAKSAEAEKVKSAEAEKATAAAKAESTKSAEAEKAKSAEAEKAKSAETVNNKANATSSSNTTATTTASSDSSAKSNTTAAPASAPAPAPTPVPVPVPSEHAKSNSTSSDLSKKEVTAPAIDANTTMSLNKTKAPEMPLLEQQKEGDSPIVNITIDSGGTTKISVGGATSGSNGVGSAGSSGNGTVTVDPLEGTAGVSGTVGGGANASVPAKVKEAAAGIAGTVSDVASETASAADGVAKKIGGAIAGITGLQQNAINATNATLVIKETPKVVTQV